MGYKVKVIEDFISKGRKRLSLDIYPAIISPKTGKKTRRVSLGRYLFIDKKELKKEIQLLESTPNKTDKQLKGIAKRKEIYNTLKPLNELQKSQNAETLRFAKQVASNKENELNKEEVYTEFERERLRIKELGEQDFIKYFKKMIDRREGSNYSNWQSALFYLQDYTEHKPFKFADLDVVFLNDFRSYLLNANKRRSKEEKLSVNTASSYFNKIKAALKQAYEEGFLQMDLNRKVKGIKEEQTIREYLTPDEAKQLWKTPFEDEIYKRAAFFSILSGMRSCDIAKLTWGEIEKMNEELYNVKFRQKKTKGYEVLPITAEAFKLLGQPQNANDKVFEGVQFSAYTNKKLHNWIKKAGIQKHITFHCFRHTFAVFHCLKETQPYTLMALMGHKNIQTTLIYAKIADSLKRSAMEKINLNLFE